MIPETEAKVGYGTSTMRPQPESPSVGTALSVAYEGMSECLNIASAIAQRLNCGLDEDKCAPSIPGIPGQVREIQTRVSELHRTLILINNTL